MLVHRDGLKVHRAAAGSRDGHPGITGVNVKPDGTCEATDGHILVRYSPTKSDDAKEYPAGFGAEDTLETAVTIPAETCKSIVKIARKGLAKRLPILARNAAVAKPNGTLPISVTDLESPTTWNLQPIESSFPDTDKVIPKRTGKGTLFSVELLTRILATMKAIGVERVELQIAGYDEKGNSGPSRIDGETSDGSVVAVIMPMHK